MNSSLPFLSDGYKVHLMQTPAEPDWEEDGSQGSCRVVQRVMRKHHAYSQKPQDGLRSMASATVAQRARTPNVASQEKVN